MPPRDAGFDFDVTIIGGGPAGLSAAVVLGRAHRSVAVFDQGRPRNYAARAVHCFLTRDGIAPDELRKLARDEAAKYGAHLFDEEVVAARQLGSTGENRTAFAVETATKRLITRTLLLSTGVADVLPDIPGFRELYGVSVHHCPYCDGWEHRDKRLAAFGASGTPAGLAASLKTWSSHVTACMNGIELDASDRRLLATQKIDCRYEKVARLVSSNGVLSEVVFESGPPLACDALFFSADQVQRSPLAQMLGCETKEEHVETEKKQGTCVEGVFVAGDADGDVQFAIVAAAEGAIAATAINSLLQKQDQAAQRSVPAV
jgi:thioredoxin reductase